MGNNPSHQSHDAEGELRIGCHRVPPETKIGDILKDYSFAGRVRGEGDSTLTPDSLYKALDAEFHFDFDPCPLNPTFDGLTVEWGKCNYVNPPYSEKIPWIMKALHSLLQGKTTVMLLPADTSTNWFHDWILPYSTVRFLRGRLTHPPNNTPAKFASMVVIFKP